MTKKPGLKEIKNTYFLRQIEPIINQLVETHKIPKEEVEEIITHFFDKLKDYVQSPFMPKVMIENFGTFKPSYKKISNYMRRMLYLRKIDCCGRTREISAYALRRAETLFRGRQ